MPDWDRETKELKENWKSPTTYASADEELEFSEAGEFDLNFSRYGEIIGKTGDSEIDEIEKEEKVVSLNVRYEQLPNGSYKVYGSLV